MAADHWLTKSTENNIIVYGGRDSRAAKQQILDINVKRGIRRSKNRDDVTEVRFTVAKRPIFVFLFIYIYTRIVYISHISKHDQLLSRSGLDNMGSKRAQSFIRKFYIFMSFFFKIENL